MDSEKQMCYWWSLSEHGAGSYSSQRGKEVVVDGWGSWNFTLNNPILSRIERKIVWLSFSSYYRRTYLFGTFCGWFVCVLGLVCWRVSGWVEFVFFLVLSGISSLLFFFFNDSQFFRVFREKRAWGLQVWVWVEPYESTYFWCSKDRKIPSLVCQLYLWIDGWFHGRCILAWTETK
jgi:hypothetical protein